MLTPRRASRGAHASTPRQADTESNLFFKRTNPLKEEVAEILLIDGHHLTPSQKDRMRKALEKEDVEYMRHCMQM